MYRLCMYMYIYTYISSPYEARRATSTPHLGTEAPATEAPRPVLHLLRMQAPKGSK